jgi:helicase
LHLGVLHRGNFHFRKFNEKSEWDEQWVKQVDVCSESKLSDQTISAIKYLVDKGEQVLIFRPTKRDVILAAQIISEFMQVPAAKSALSSLAECPPSIQNNTLARCLGHGIAFHHADLDEYQRGLVEDGFKQGEIKVLVSTSTLAVGVNLPAKNVFIETLKYSAGNLPGGAVPLSPIDFHQVAGRAGRFGCERNFGRAIMAASTPFEKEILWEKYVYAPNEDPAPGMTIENLPEFAFRLVACAAATNPHELIEAYRRSYSAHTGGRPYGRPYGRMTAAGAADRDIEQKTSEALVMLEKGGLIGIRSWGKLEPSFLGRAAGATGLGVRSIIEILERIRSREDSSIYESLVLAVEISEWRDDGGRYSLRMRSTDALIARAYELLGEETVASSTVLSQWLRDAADPRMKNGLASFLFALDWAFGTPTYEMEQRYGKGAGGLKRDACTLSWILTSIERLTRVAISPSQADNRTADVRFSSRLGGLRSLNSFSERLRYGVIERLLPLAKALNIDREFVRLLDENGIRSCENLMAADAGVLSSILPKSVFARVLNWREKYADEPLKAATDSITPESNGRLAFTGRNDKLRSEVVIDGKRIWLQPRLYAYLQKLWVAYRSDSPWVPKEALDISPYQSKYVSKLKKQIRETGAQINIESNGRGAYALRMK